MDGGKDVVTSIALCSQTSSFWAASHHIRSDDRPEFITNALRPPISPSSKPRLRRWEKRWDSPPGGQALPAFSGTSLSPYTKRESSATPRCTRRCTAHDTDPLSPRWKQRSERGVFGLLSDTPETPPDLWMPYSVGQGSVYAFNAGDLQQIGVMTRMWGFTNSGRVTHQCF